MLPLADARFLRHSSFLNASRALGQDDARPILAAHEFPGGGAHLKSRVTHADDEDTRRLERVGARQAMSNDLLKEKVRHLEAARRGAPD